MKRRNVAGAASGVAGASAASAEKQKKFGSQTPFGRPGMPAEFEGIHVQLADNQSSFANGQIYGSAGGSRQP